MKTQTYILAAGNQTRWLLGNLNYKHKCKQLVPIQNEPLITRTARQARGETFVVTNNIDIAKAAGCKVINPDNYISIVDTLSSTFDNYDADRIVILLGDVLYSPKAIEMIYSYDNSLMFFGHSQEIFAMVFTDIEKIKLAVETVDMPLKKMKLWHLYRYLHGIEYDKHEISRNFTFIKDITQDFDDWRQYEKYIKK